MGNNKRTKRLTIIFLITLCISIVTLTGLYLYVNRHIGSGFLYERLAQYISYQGQSNINIGWGHSFPFAPFFLISVSEITGLKMTDVIYLPYLVTIPLFYSYFFTRYFVSDKRYAILLALSIFLLTPLGSLPHITEYAMGYLLYPVFAVLILKYIDKRDNRYVVLSILMLMTMKFYYPYEEIFSLTFLLILTLLLYVSQQYSFNFLKSDIKKLKKLEILCLLGFVSLLSYQPKGEGLINRMQAGIYELDFFNTIKNFFLGLSEGNDIILEYGVPRRAPFIPFILNTLLTIILVLCIVILFIMFFWLLAKYRSTQNIKFKDIILVILMFGYVPFILARIAIGHFLIFRPIYIIGPVFIYHFLKRNKKLIEDNRTNNTNFIDKYIVASKVNNAIPHVIVLFIVTLIICHHGATLISDTHRPIGSDDINSSLVIQVGDSFDGDTRILTDLDTFGVIITYLALEGYESRNVSQVRYTDERYSYIIGKDNVTEAQEIDIILVNYHNINRPLQRGEPDWAYFRPLSEHKEDLQYNYNINVIYDSGGYVMYVPNTK